MTSEASQSESVYTIVYVSRLNGKMDRDRLRELNDQAREKNAQLGLTGLLVHKANHFLQVIEGGKKEVEEIMEAIKKDPRHKDVTMIARVPDQPRRFSRWSMAIADWPEDNEELSNAYDNLLEEMRNYGSRLGPPAPIIDFLESLSRHGTFFEG